MIMVCLKSDSRFVQSGGMLMLSCSWSRNKTIACWEKISIRDCIMSWNYKYTWYKHAYIILISVAIYLWPENLSCQLFFLWSIDIFGGGFQEHEYLLHLTQSINITHDQYCNLPIFHYIAATSTSHVTKYCGLNLRVPPWTIPLDTCKF